MSLHSEATLNYNTECVSKDSISGFAIDWKLSIINIYWVKLCDNSFVNIAENIKNDCFQGEIFECNSEVGEGLQSFPNL